jgi:hypothetical protein
MISGRPWTVTLSAGLLALGLMASVSARASAAGDPVIAAAGDVACDPSASAFHSGNGTASACRQKYTAALLAAGGYDAILPLGDQQYECGGLSAFQTAYGPSWGQPSLFDKSYPIPGNHEYETKGGTDCGTNASGYYTYFGARAHQESNGYYSYDIGTWHLIALNSQCTFVLCKKGSAQELWLKNDLATHTNSCVLAYWHDPRFASRPTGAVPAKTLPWWNDLYAARADIILGASYHVYERFDMLDPSGNVNRDNGIREFVVGTGGKSLGGAVTQMPGSLLRDRTHYGALTLTLHDDSYDWAFVAENGAVLDSGSSACV